MRRGIRIALAGTVAAGAVLAGAGTAYAGVGTSPSHHGDDDDNGHGCDYRVAERSPLKESDFPSDNHFEAYKNTTKKDSLDAHGKPYFLHNKVCQNHKPWRSTKYWEDEYGDESYDTIKYKYDKKTGFPSRDPKKNSYTNSRGYNKSYSKDRKDLDRDQIGAPKNPREEPR